MVRCRHSEGGGMPSATELGNRTGDVPAAAAQGPVRIVKHGKTRFVVPSSERFKQMR